MPGREEVHHVSQGRGSPATSLVEELVECFRGKGQGVGAGAVVDSMSLLKKKCAEPTILTCKINTNHNDRLVYISFELMLLLFILILTKKTPK